MVIAIIISKADGVAYQVIHNANYGGSYEVWFNNQRHETIWREPAEAISIALYLAGY